MKDYLKTKFNNLNEVVNKNKTLVSITALLYFLPLLTGNTISALRSTLFLLTTILIFGLLTLSFELQLGRNGLLNFGHAALFGVGAYSATFVLSYLDDLNLPSVLNIGSLQISVATLISPFWLVGILFAILVGSFVGLIMGLTTNRMKGTGFAFIALAIAMVLFSLFAENSELSGGETGLPVPIPDFYFSPDIYYIFAIIITPILLFLFILVVVNDLKNRKDLFGFSLISDPLKESKYAENNDKKTRLNSALVFKILLFTGVIVILGYFILFEVLDNIAGMSIADDFIFIIPIRYYFVLSCSILTYIFVKKLVHSQFGRVIAAISQNEERAKALGYNVYMYKIKTLIISGGIAGFAGALFAPTIQIIDPETTLGVGITVEVMIYSIVGGLGTLFGPFLGAGLVIISEFRLAEILDVLNISLFGINIEGEWWVLILGALYISIVVFFPFGIVGTVQIRSRKIIEKLRMLRISEEDFWWIGMIIMILVIGILINSDLYIDGLRDYLSNT